MGTADLSRNDRQHAEAICKEDEPQHEIMRRGKQPRLSCLASLGVLDKPGPALEAAGPDKRPEREQVCVDKEEDQL
eukprot:292693-Prymnesium_polylepis.1